MKHPGVIIAVMGTVYFVLAVPPAAASDWPMWRNDAARSAASADELPEMLHLQWSRPLPAITPAWPNEPRLHFDEAHEPIVAGQLVLFGSPVDGSVTAYETATGDQRWKFFTEGPVRFAPVAWEDKVYVGSDDGYMYCLRAADGEPLWKVRGAPADRPERRHLGNARLISFWPVRGGPVLADGTLYFGAGVWPTMGVFVVAVDARTGETVWRNDRLDLIDDVRLDHNVLQESGLSPQGYLVVQGDLLLVPNGRSMPAGLDRKSGELRFYVQGYRNGDCRVVAAGPYALVGETGAIDLSTGREVGSRWLAAGDDAPNAFDPNRFHLFEGPIHPYKEFPGCSWQSVVCGSVTYGLHNGTFYAYDLDGAEVSEYESKGHGGRILKPWRWVAPLVWKLAGPDAAQKPAGAALIRAGNRLYGSVGRTLTAVELPGPNDAAPSIAWQLPMDVPAVRLIAGDGRLFVVGSDGRLECYGGQPKPEMTVHDIPQPTPPEEVQSEWTARVANLLRQTGIAEGYCLVLGVPSSGLVDALLAQSQLKVIAVDPDRDLVGRLRETLAARGLYGERAEVFVGNPWTFPFPPYLASLMVVPEAPDANGNDRLPVEQIFDVLRPYGGTACFLGSDGWLDSRRQQFAAADLEGAEVHRKGELVLLTRAGPLAGAAKWTHESADAARSYFSREQRVQAPLGLLWYGDGPDHGFWKRKDYGTGVKPQVVGGRVFAFQVSTRTLQAYDVYTGRLLWKEPVDPFARCASLNDGIYVAGGDRVRVLDPATGAEKAAWPLEMEPGETPFVADIRVGEDLIVVAAAPQKVRVIEEGLWDSTMLIALDRASGKTLWRRKAQDRFNNHAIALGGGIVFCIDSVSPIESAQANRRGEMPETLPSTVLALDARTGQVRWSTVKEHPYRTYGLGSWLGMRGNDDWLAYCEASGLLLAGKHGRAFAFQAAGGEQVWEAPIGGHPWILCGETFLTQQGASFEVRTGEKVGDPVTLRGGGCNYAVAAENLIFVRDQSASYVDVATGEKQRLYAARSGCSNSLIAADGVLSVPNFSVGCICNYPVQTAFALVSMPEAAAWHHDTPIPQALDPRQAEAR
ncbi:MAG: PQQ-binding-like beta-propeller repeat protein [Thermoguttaceae bacterium]|jgi:outer membrane protein assembly factor BamB|nr:PQQ-binding-like beta-propeller repeat protein [Thermoguttaceae bacterium]